VFEHNSVVNSVEGALEVRVHDVDVFVVFFASSIIMMMVARAS
jgi:hypothetical protein